MREICSEIHGKVPLMLFRSASRVLVDTKLGLELSLALNWEKGIKKKTTGMKE